MKKSLLSALGLAVALAFTVPVIGATSADAAPMAKHHRHHHHYVRHHHHHHHHVKKMSNKAY
jgi:protein BEAN1